MCKAVKALVKAEKNLHPTTRNWRKFERKPIDQDWYVLYLPYRRHSGLIVWKDVSDIEDDTTCKICTLIMSCPFMYARLCFMFALFTAEWPAVCRNVVMSFVKTAFTRGSIPFCKPIGRRLLGINIDPNTPVLRVTKLWWLSPLRYTS